MKKLLIFLVATSLAFSMTSCMEECEKNKTGDVTVTNNTDETLWFDVTGDDGATTENRSLTPGASTTYSVPAGTIKVWASYNNVNDEFQLVETKTLTQCETITYQTPSQACELFNITDITVVNNVGIELSFDVWIYDENMEDGGYYLGEQVIPADHQYTYLDVWIGDGWANFEYLNPGDDTWYASNDDYEVNACTPFTFTWNAGKSADVKVPQNRLELKNINRAREIKR